MKQKENNNINNLKDVIQKEAVKSIYKSKGRSLITMATGAGKSRIPLLYLKEKEYHKIALIVPTEKLRDNNWKDEYDQWGMSDYWSKTTPLCYASASKIKNKTFDLVILDEAHNITDLSIEFFKNNNIKDVIALTISLPEDENKLDLFKSIDLTHSYDLNLDDAVKMGIVSDYRINVIYTELDHVNKNIKAGNKTISFYQTEKKAYDYLTTQINTTDNYAKKSMLIFKRLQFLSSLKSKTKIAENFIANLNPHERTLIFCGDIKQAETLCNNTYHSKTDDKDLIDFINQKINRLSCVKALNEGINIPMMNNAVIVSFDSKEKNLKQRIGRIIRLRANHTGNIIIFCCKNTQEEEWLSKVLCTLDQSKINYYHSINSYYAKHNPRVQS